ncbi:trypsin-like serine protease [Lujinxingia vulgaris]|uniref:Trypsin-like serine protease n=1 Tax=Lujinxingia vulgaris TaxID=2600176 RepID=A0A5C6X9D2_9DELT|nr:trypsin-like peptidase domain-containing protein [Lujinxingia vulgaris]TXD33839.1 trypsin-like serine protease [Lujinxingia vulgaris]
MTIAGEHPRRSSLFLLSALAAFILSACQPSPDTPSSPDPGEAAPTPQADALPSAMPPDFSTLVGDARPAVVNIYTRTTAPRPRSPLLPPGMAPPEREQQSLGSGFIFDSQGLVLTNEHVVRDATQIAVRLLDDRVFEADIVGTDPQTDVAVLQLRDADELPTLPLADSDALLVGQWVIAIGNPLGLTSTVTAGITSATGRQVIPPGGQLRYQDFIQTDASINPGNSGGPLLNVAGQVVGICTAIVAQGQGLGFAIPINMVKTILPALIEEGRVSRAWLGAYVSEVPDALRAELELGPGGALITRVIEGSPGQLAGLKPGDIVLRIAAEEVTNANQLSWVASNLSVGQPVPVHIQRGSESVELTLTPAPQPD